MVMQVVHGLKPHQKRVKVTLNQLSLQELIKQMKKFNPIFNLLLISLITTLTTSYSLQGNWTITNYPNSSQPIQVSIIQSIFRGSSIVNILSIQTCPALKYQVNIDQNNFYINFDTQLINQQQVCNNVQNSMAHNIRRDLRKVLSFKINDNQLELNDPTQQSILALARKINHSARIQLKGSWIINFEDASEGTFVMLVDSNILQVCGTSFSYQLSDRYGISVRQDGRSNCQVASVTQAVASVVFIRRNGNRIEFYDRNVRLVMTAVVDPASAQRPQITSNTAQITSTGSVASTTSQSQSAASTSTRQAQLQGLMPGRYIFLLLFRRDLARSRIDVTSSQIKIKLCSQLVFDYVIQNQKISISTKSIPDTTCKRVDETVYIRTLLSARTFKKDKDNFVVLMDESGRQIISMAP